MCVETQEKIVVASANLQHEVVLLAKISNAGAVIGHRPYGGDEFSPNGQNRPINIKQKASAVEFK